MSDTDPTALVTESAFPAARARDAAVRRLRALKIGAATAGTAAFGVLTWQAARAADSLPPQVVHRDVTVMVPVTTVSPPRTVTQASVHMVHVRSRAQPVARVQTAVQNVVVSNGSAPPPASAPPPPPTSGPS